MLWFMLQAPERLREGCSIMIVVATKEHPANCYTSWDGRLQYGLIMPKGGLKEMCEEHWVGQAVRSVPTWLAEHILAHRDEIEGPTRLNRQVQIHPHIPATYGPRKYTTASIPIATKATKISAPANTLSPDSR